MAKQQSEIIREIRQNIQNGRAAIAYGLDLNDVLVNGIWRYFSDVEIYVPLQVMPMTADERKSLAGSILEEMDTTMSDIEKLFDSAASEEELDKISSGPLGRKVDNLWKELAGCYAEIINDEIPQLPESMKEAIAESMVEELAARYDTSREDIVRQIRKDSSLRMLFRRTGINPDEIS